MNKKIGRNEPCSCRSGKKFKKCCLNSSLDPLISLSILETPEKHQFHLKGKTGEEFVHELAKKTFLLDWCFLNPKLPDGKELCDLLIVFDNIAIIWQIKNTKLKDDTLKEKDYRKNIRQLVGAKKTLQALKSALRLKNGRGFMVDIVTTNLTEIYLISAFVGDEPIINAGLEDIGGNLIRIFTKSFVNIALNELDTVKDFIEYIQKTKKFLKETAVIINGGEEQLLGIYIKENRNLEKINSVDSCYIEDGIWDSLTSNKRYIQRKKDDKISYVWDRLIDMSFETRSPNYEIISRELASLTRFERRCMAHSFWESYNLGCKNSMSYFRRTATANGITFCFLFQKYDTSMDIEEYRIARANHLSAYMYCARGESVFINNTKVIGIATGLGKMNSFDFGLFVQPTWTEEDQKEKEEIQSKTDIFNNTHVQNISMQEYRNVLKK